MYKYFFINLCLINICFNLDYLTPTYFLNNKNQSTSEIALQTEGFNHLIGIMIEFPIERDEFEDRNDNGYWDENDYLLIDNLDENNNKRTPDYHDYNNNGKYDKYLKDGKWYYEDYDNPKTSGLGKFILNDSLWNYNLESFTSRCDNLIIDNFPHDSNYFLNQLTAVKNYYYEISNQLIDFEIHMIDHIYNAQHQMEYYSASDQELGELFSEALNLSKEDIEYYLNENNIDVNDVLFVVFHAGLGQDFSVPFLDPTTNDLKSAYIDDEMLELNNLVEINNASINRGILLPETQNFIFYDVVEDIFPELKDDMGYCGIQVGLTGTFAFLLGYGLDLDPMFLPDGTTGIGKFGLMDYGSNNGRGVIPAAPTPWTRIKIADKYSNSNNLVTTISQPGTYTLSPRNIEDMIYKINISASEYYLIENINNNIVDEFDLEFLQFLYGGLCGENIDPNNINSDDISAINECIKNSTSTDRFDYFNLLDTLDVFNIENSVLTSVNNYDYGLPGSGLLIWHIDEDRIYNNLYCENINCDLENRGVQLEEADGAIDIGYNSSHPLFDDHINGWKYDFWYPGNDYYFDYGNPSISNNDTIFFNDNSIPNTKSNLGSSSLVSIEIISENEGDISFQVSFDNLYESIFLSDSPIKIIGSGNINDIGNIFYIQNDIVYKHNDLEKVVLEEDAFEKKVLVYNNNYHFVDIVEDSLIYWDPNTELITTQVPFLGGYYESLNSLTFLESLYSDISLGDLDSDGLDELVFTLSDSSLVVQNFNETYVNGFPVEGNFHGTPIIANIINIEDNKPEIISREGNDITILSSTGQRMLELSSFDTNQDIRIIPSWKDNKAALVDGQRLIFIDYDSQYSYWLNKYSNSYDYPITLNQNNSSSEFRTNYQSAYNYPNPITRGYTTFRFYVQNETQVKINVYDINGFKVESFSTNGVSQNEYNEINWNNIKDLSPGLYYAEVIFESRESELIKLAIIR